eukprot:scaffold1962_cov180-Ochromonas_danica.AAC.13
MQESLKANGALLFLILYITFWPAQAFFSPALLRLVHGRPPFSSLPITTSTLRTSTPSLIALQGNSPAVEDGVSVASLSDHTTTAVHLASTITRWLDESYAPLPMHKDIGEVIAQDYLHCRQDLGLTDLTEIMLHVGGKLQDLELESTFVTQWDLINKLSDLLMLQLGREQCACDRPLYAKPSIKKVYQLVENWSSTFDRYRFVQQFLLHEEDDNWWDEMNILAAVVMGFRWIFRQGVFDSEFPLTRRFLSDEDYENDEEEEEERGI